MARDSSESDWGVLEKQIAKVAEDDPREEVAVARQVAGAISDALPSGERSPWLTLAETVLEPSYRSMQAAINALTRLPSEAGYKNLLSASGSALATLPAVHEARVISLSEEAAAGIQATNELKAEIAKARLVIDGESARFAQLMSLAADDTLARSYAGEAERESRRADRWRIATVALLLIAVAIAAFAAVKTFSETIDSKEAAARLGLSAAIASFAAYLQHQATIHRKREGAARSAELRLRTIGPFSASLPEAEAASIRVAVGMALFANQEPFGDRMPGEEQAKNGK